MGSFAADNCEIRLSVSDCVEGVSDENDPCDNAGEWPLLEGVVGLLPFGAQFMAYIVRRGIS